MISAAMTVNQTCGICYVTTTIVSCKRCTFAMCETCTTKYKVAVNQTNPTIPDQCPQCKYKTPWIRSYTLDDIDDIDDIDDSNVELTELSINSHQEIQNHIPDIENQLTSNQHDEHDEDDEHDEHNCKFLYKTFTKYVKILCYVIVGIFVIQLAGFLFFLTSNNHDILWKAIAVKNIQQIIILMMLYFIAGIFILIGIAVAIACIIGIFTCFCILINDDIPGN